MKRLHRRHIAFLLFCSPPVVLFLLWLQSYREMHGLLYVTNDGGRYVLVAVGGWVDIGHSQYLPDGEHGLKWLAVPLDEPWVLERALHRLGPVAWGLYERRGVTYMVDDGSWHREEVVQFQEVAVQGWLLAILFGIPPAMLLVGFLRRRRRLRSGLCVACGYDLRSSPERCPECGAAPAGAKRGESEGSGRDGRPRTDAEPKVVESTGHRGGLLR